jgi:tetratricopeptide (TPR) repeat protein
MLLCAVALLPFLLLKDRRFAWFWMIVFFVALLPVSQIVPLITLMNDRYLYFPMLGVSGLVVAFAQELPCKLDKPVIAIALTLLLFLGIGAYQRTHVWAGSVPLWSDVTEKQPKSFTARYGLGLAYYDEQEYLRATKQFQAALQIKPADDNALYGLGLALLADGRFRMAEPVFDELTQQRPLDPVLLRLAGHIQYFQGDWLQSRQYYEREVMVAGATASSLNYLSLVEQRAGFAQKSAQRFAQALDAGATAGELYLERARLESLARNRQDALEYLSLALDAGTDSIEELREDPDLRYIQQTAEFERLLTSAEY